MGFGRVVVSALALSLFSGSGFSQVTTGLPPFGSFSGGPFDTVNNANLNVHYGVPIFGRSGRGLSFAETLTYDSSIWTPVSGVWTPVTYWGWGNPPTAVTGVVTYTECSPWRHHNDFIGIRRIHCDCLNPLPAHPGWQLSPLTVRVAPEVITVRCVINAGRRDDRVSNGRWSATEQPP